MARHLITSALPYINGVKHLGNLVGSILPADVYARFMRARGHDVLYICATDEHGTPAELAAAADNKDVDIYCREMHDVQENVYRGFDISFDWFGRSHSQQNHDLTQHLYKKLDENGLIEEVESLQVYSIDDGRFLPDRYVEGTCPHCGYERARGDQCESCTKVLDPTDLVNPRSALSGSTNIEIRPSKHLYLRQSKMVDELRKWIDTKTDWPHLVTSIARKWLDEGLKDRSITRDLKWGIPVAYKGVPRPGFEDKVFYVWFDAPIEYIGATAEWAEATGGDWESWWREDKGADTVRYTEFMGKDNIPFHTVGFPATLLGSKEPWKKADYIKGFNWLNYYGGKFSTSGKRGIFMDKAIALLPADYWRWYLMANAPESQDSSFSWEHFQSIVNKDLCDVLGNFANRILKFTAARFDGKIPAAGEYGPVETETLAAIEEKFRTYTDCMEQMEFRKAAAELRAIWMIGNEYLQRAEPWAIFKQDPEKAGASIRFSLELIRLFAALSAPLIPDAARRMAESVACTGIPAWPSNVKDNMSALETGAPLPAPEILFKKIEDEQITEWIDTFGGAES